MGQINITNWTNTPDIPLQIEDLYQMLGVFVSQGCLLLWGASQSDVSDVRRSNKNLFLIDWQSF